MKNKFNSKGNKIIFRIMLSSCYGAVLLSLLSIPQKAVLGADPFILKGFIVPVLFGAVGGAVVGKYVIQVKKLNVQLKARINNLEDLLPICSNCKKIRLPDSDPKKEDSWVPIESYISNKTSTEFSHGICPECMKKLYGDILNSDQ